MIGAPGAQHAAASVAPQGDEAQLIEAAAATRLPLYASASPQCAAASKVSHVAAPPPTAARTEEAAAGVQEGGLGGA